MTGQAIILDDHVFVADVASHRSMHGHLDAALDGREPNILIGAKDLDDIDPDKTESGLFWPMHLAYDGTHLYVAEYKFSGRVMRYAVR